MSTKRKLPTKLGQPAVKQSAKVVGKGNLNESKTVVTGGGNATKRSTNLPNDVVSISSGDDSSEDDGGEGLDDSAGEFESEAGDIAMEGAEMDGTAPEEAGEEDAEPSFGDLVRANASEPIDVAAAFDNNSNRELAFPTKIQPPSGASLGTVLTQALKTNDITLLETCLQTTDVNTIRATIQRLESPFAGKLLQQLAERLHRRPGRAGSLMVWVQWTLVTHGGYLATQRELIKKLDGLNRVIDERAKGLQSLLSLKGKLDMLEAQIELRRSMQDQRRRLDDDELDDDVIYVEGEESDQEGDVAKPKRLATNGDLVEISDNESESSEDMPTANGLVAESEEAETSDEEDGLVDDEAEETDRDSGSDAVEHTDADSDSYESDDAPAPKMQRTGGGFSKKR